MGGPKWVADPSGGWLLQVLKGVDSLAFEHNTAFSRGSILTVESPPSRSFIFRNNIVFQTIYGIVGRGAPAGIWTLGIYFPKALFLKNVIVGQDPWPYPGGNFFPRSLHDVGFYMGAGADYHLDARSRYKNKGTDNKDPGADIQEVKSATTGVIEGLMK
jgi:hypothetical protein